MKFFGLIMEKELIGSKTIQNIVNQHLDVYQISTSDATLVLDYHWSDDNYKDIQVNLLH